MNHQSNDVILELRNVSKTFGPTKALTNVDFQLRKGEIHALAGENGAGKSTLMNIIDGIHQPDDGQILIKGKSVVIDSPLAAQRYGIGFVHQEIALCPDVTVAENISMAYLNASRKWLVNFRDLNRRAKEALKPLAAIDPEIKVGYLSISNQQLVEIAKAMTLDCDVLILDEPTAALTESESRALFRIMQDFRERGISIIYISHRMAEIFEQCDRVTILRDGVNVCTKDITDTSPEDVVANMVGRELGNLYPDKMQNRADAAEPILEASGYTDGYRFFDIGFRLVEGEILGIAGLIGAGRSEVVKAICGLHSKTAGELVFRGKPVAIRHYLDSIAQGIVYLSEDRKGDGVFLDLSIAQNISALNVEQVSSKGLISKALEREQTSRLSKQLNLKCGSIDDKVSSLSGGNQQKVAIAKMLSVKPSVVIMDEPTRGIDVGAKSEIHRLIRQLANDGVGVIVISSELPEIIGLCDRVMVMHEGRNGGVLSGEALNEEAIIRLASGLAANDYSGSSAESADVPVSSPSQGMVL